MPKPPEAGVRANPALEAVIVLFMCSAGIGLARAWKSGQDTGIDYAVMLAVPAAAALLFALITSFVPSLVAGGRLRFPLNFTLPLVYTALLALAVALIARLGSNAAVSLTKMPAELRNLHVWAEERTLGFSLVAQVIALSALAAFNSGRKPSA